MSTLQSLGVHMKFKSKKDFLNLTAEAWAALWVVVDSFDDKRFSARLRRAKGSEIAWSVKDVLAHRYAWHGLALGRFRSL